MAVTISTFSDSIVRQIGNVLESAASHRELTALFGECKIVEHGGNLSDAFPALVDGTGG